MTHTPALPIILTIALGLVLDQYGGPWATHAVSLWTWGLLALLLQRAPSTQRAAMLACLLIATAGELFLALAWGLYSYREAGLPLFVPPGHVLLYMLGLALAERMPSSLVRPIGAVAAIAAAGLWMSGVDALSALLVALFLLCLRFGPAPRLYATMFLLSLAMELWGTWLGNWQWQAHAPWLGWATMNPPFAAGAFYCVLDMLVGLLAGRGPVTDIALARRS
ncbi:MAG: hypothetical protein KF909_05590 [Rhodocyclaceae bacterium]|nr:hypothetical protein [Rhodocyclaceae bacterium]MCP5231664.1 hypothetical protein [Zoogloeaceae bacterium]MCB1911809.1 hypothetical protein [Rhodocyclaceae bacterium]MCP5239995.1 hypothetical protein [Zoogloeaceae bacterium]MCP5253776.1 hypothetical protein [Zoogloeaceae bacterium]